MEETQKCSIVVKMITYSENGLQIELKLEVPCKNECAFIDTIYARSVPTN